MNILYLTFYYEPDLCAGSFRNTPIVNELSKRKELEDGGIDVLTTMPNRYSTYQVNAEKLEKNGNVTIYRIPLPNHKSGFWDQIKAFQKYFFQTLKIVRNKKYDLVVSSSSRLFTAFLGALIAKQKGIPLFLDIRDLFKDTITDMFQNKVINFFLKHSLSTVEKFTFGQASHINLVSEGFMPYFEKYKQATYSFYTNGIDDVFLNKSQRISSNKTYQSKKLTILYAGNIGEGQGLHQIIPEAAKELEENFEFIIIGDGGAKKKLQEGLKLNNCINVKLLPPVGRDELINNYYEADYLFVHLNDLKAFEKVLPSKIFEYASFNKPIIAGLKGYSATFLKKNVINHILFPPCDSASFVNKIRNHSYQQIDRKLFKETYSRENIVKKLVDEILTKTKAN